MYFWMQMMARNFNQNREWGLTEVRDGGLKIHRDQNVIIGAKNICAYIGLKSLVAMHRWVDKHAFPAVMRPDGMWMTTMTAVDEWLWLCLESKMAVDEREFHAPSAIALKCAEKIGYIRERPSYARTNNEYKRAWEKRTGRDPRFYEGREGSEAPADEPEPEGGKDS